MTSKKQLMKEVTTEGRIYKVKKIWQKYKKPIIYTSIAALLIIATTTIFNIYNIYKQNQEKKYSAIMQQILIDEQNSEDELVQSKLKDLYEDKSVPTGIKSLASLKYASILLKNGQAEKAVNIYLEVNQNKKTDQFLKELSGLSALKALIDSNNDSYEQQIINLSANLEKNSKILKYFIIEQKGLFEWGRNNFKIAYEIFKELEQNPEVPEQIKDRAIEINKIYESKYISK